MKHEHTLQDGTSIAYWEYNPGNAQSIFMVHGFRGTHHGLLKITKELPEYTIIIPDLPGFGVSQAYSDKPHNVENYAASMLELFHHLKLKHPTLLGHSMGSIIAAAMITKKPTLSKKLILVNPISSKPVTDRFALQTILGAGYHVVAGRMLPKNLGNALLKNALILKIGSLAMVRTKNPALRQWIHRSHITHMREFSHPKVIAEANRSSCLTSVGDYRNALTMPTLLISGQKDGLTSVQQARKLAAKLPHATLVEVPRVGHLVHYEQPERVAAEIKTFLD